MNKNRGRNISIILVMLAVVLLIYSVTDPTGTSAQYYEIVQQFEDQQVNAFSLNLGSGKLSYRLVSDERQGEEYNHLYSVPDVGLFLDDIRPLIDEYNEANEEPMKFDYVAASSFWSILLNVLPILMIIGLMVFVYINMTQQGSGRINSVGKARTKNAQDEGRTATFDDVAGAEEEKAELQEIVEYLKNPQEFNMLGASIPKGVLLVGPPGTGKTLLARAVAGEAGVPFYSISGSDFVELYVGVGASRVRDLFDKAKRTRPSIIFIDEIDAVGRRRGAGLGGGHDEREQTLNQLLVEMDGFGTNEGVIVMAATNRADILDPALLRPGRFDREVYVGYPDIKGREEILKIHSRGKPFAPDVDLKTLAKTTVGFTGADLENLLNEAALLAARRKRKAITQEDVEEAAIKVVMGPEKKSAVVTERDRKITAYHEAGHALANYYEQPDKLVHQISIIRRGMAAGYTMPLPNEDDNHVTKNQMNNELVTLLGGRVAESIIFDDVSTGASNDLERATGISRSMVMKYGFSEKIGPVVYSTESNEVFIGRDFAQSRNYSDKVASEIDHEVKRIIEEAYGRCVKVLRDNVDKLHKVANALLEFEKIDGDTFKKLMTDDGDALLVETNAADEEVDVKPESPEVDDEKKEEETDAGELGSSLFDI